MRLNDEWFTKVNSMMGKIGSLKFYSGLAPETVGLHPTEDFSYSTDTGNTITLPQLGSYSNLYGLAWGNSGAKLYVQDHEQEGVLEYNLSTLYDISTAAAPVFFSTGAIDSSGRGIAISDDGTKFYLAGWSSDELYMWDLSTPWDVATGVISANTWETFNVMGMSARDIWFGNSGTRFYMVDDYQGKISQGTLSTAWDITTIIMDDTTFDSGFDQKSVQLSQDGSKMYVLEQTNNRIMTFILSTPWDVATATDASKNLSVIAGIGHFAIAETGVATVISGQESGIMYEFRALTNTKTDICDFTESIMNDDNNVFVATKVGSDTKMTWQGSAVQAIVSTGGDISIFTMECYGASSGFKVDGTITITGGGGDIEYSNVSVSVGDTIEVPNISFLLKNVYSI